MNKQLAKNLFHIKPASLLDGEFIWSVRNHKTSRIWFDGKKIELKDHLKWFKKEYLNANSHFFIGMSGTERVGYLRFSMIEDKHPVISYGVTSSLRKRGYGMIILKMGTAHFFRTHPDINKVIASAHKQNIPSIKSFRRAGFNESEGDKHFHFELSR